MKLKYLGTAAAEAVPAPFCQCEICENARQKGGRNIRTRSQALLDGRLLIDFPADTYFHTLRDGLKLFEIDSCIVTHCHEDHIYPAELECLISWAAHRKEPKAFHLYGTEPVVRMVNRQCPDIERILSEGGLCLHEIRPFEPFEVEGYRVTALKADHGAEQSVVYAIEGADRAVLYAHDTGLLPQESMGYLRESGLRFDLISYDCTNGLLQLGEHTHMGLYGAKKLRAALEEMGAVSAGCCHVVNHFSHNGGAGYDEILPAAEEQGFQVSYDGMEVNF